MKVVVALDKFKGSLSSLEAACAVAEGLARVWPHAQCVLVPVADGGDGTAQALSDARGGRAPEQEGLGPDGKPCRAAVVLLDDGLTAVVELARASGLALVPAGSNDPLTATTYGTGQLIAAAIEAGAKRIILAVGGSATNDGGAGALQALGAGFFDGQGRPLGPGGAELRRLARVDDAALRDRLRDLDVVVATDVTNPLCGSNGASAVYGPQKGASPADVARLDAALSHFADVVAAALHSDMRDLPGAGAAGGIGFGFLALAGARLQPGADIVLEVVDLESKLEGADLVITGEGRLDRQTGAGKAPAAVARRAQARGIPCVALAGAVELSAADAAELGFAATMPIVPGPMTADEAMRRAAPLCADAAERMARALALRVG